MNRADLEECTILFKISIAEKKTFFQNVLKYCQISEKIHINSITFCGGGGESKPKGNEDFLTLHL